MQLGASTFPSVVSDVVLGHARKLASANDKTSIENTLSVTVARAGLVLATSATAFDITLYLLFVMTESVRHSVDSSLS